MNLVVLVYALTKGFPRDELFGLTSQIRRAAVSIPSNIAEGQARSSVRDFLRFLAFAKGSLAELDTQLLIAVRLGYIEASAFSEARTKIDGVARMLTRLEQILNRRISPAHA